MLASVDQVKMQNRKLNDTDCRR